MPFTAAPRSVDIDSALQSDGVAPKVTLAMATQRQGAAIPVPSPCIAVCKMMPDTGLCAGCYRTIEEISAWGRMADVQKLEIWALIEQRQS